MSIKKVKIFISCPGDVEREARRAIKMCEELSAEYLENDNIKIETIYWKDRNKIERRITGEPTQVFINQQLEDHDCDIYAGLFWKKLGKKNKRTNLTPTEEEFEIALKKYIEHKRPYVSLFFKTTKLYPSSSNDTEELLNVIKFKESVFSREIGLCHEFSKQKEFDNLLKIVIERYIKDNLRKINKSEITKKINPDVASSLKEISYLMDRSVYTRDEIASKNFLFSSKGIDLQSLLKDKRRIVVLGDAGAGKTVELKKLYNKFSKEDAFYYSFYIELNKYIAGDMADILPANWKDVPEEQRLLIFDGLDEVESVHQNEVRKSIEKIAETSKSSRIVVSCRKNFYDTEVDGISGTLKDFDEYILYDLSSEEYCLFIEKVLGEEGKEKFLKGVYEHELNDYLGVPFYLVNLVEVFKDNLTFPKSKLDILKSFVDLRLKLDIEHFRTTIDLRSQKDDIITNLKRLALAMETIGKNNIILREVSRYVDNRDIRELLIHGTLISLNETGTDKETWQFEHNNFQEYMAAQALSNLDLDKILDFVYDENSNQIIPHWSNTVNFLVSIRVNNDFLEWLLEKEPEMLIKSEWGKFSKKQRIKIFKDIFNKYKEKQIWIDDNYFRHDDLARFGQCDEIVHFLISQNAPQTPRTALIEAIRLLREMEINDKYKSSVIYMLKERALDPSRGDYVQYNALLTLGEKSKFHDQTLIEEILAKLKKSDNRWVRMGVYRLLINSPLFNQFIDVFLDGILYYYENYRSSCTTYLDEPILIQRALNKIKGKSIIKVVDFIKNNYSQFNYVVSDVSEFWKKLVTNAVESYEDNDSIFHSMLSIMQDIHVDSGEIAVFFFKTHTNQRAVKRLLKGNFTWQIVLCLVALADEETLDKICLSYSDGILEDYFIKDLLTGLKNNNKLEIYQDFYKKINQISNNRFVNDKGIDFCNFQDNAKIKKQKDFDLLFNKDLFLKEINAIFQFKNTTELSYNDCVDLLYREQNDFAPNVINKLEDLVLQFKKDGKVDSVEESIITQNDAIKYFKELDWDYFSVVEIYNKLNHNDENLQPSEEQRKYINEKYDYYLNQVDFKHSLKCKTNGNATVNKTAVILNYFLRKFKFNTPKKVLYDMLFFDPRGMSTLEEGIEYLKDFLTPLELKKQILNNLSTQNLNPIVFQNHIEYCHKNSIKIYSSIVQDKLINNNSYEPMKDSCLEYICSFADDWVQILEKLLTNCKSDFRWKIIEKLIPEASIPCKVFLENLMKNAKDEQEKLKAIEKSLEMQNLEALKIFTDHLCSNENIPSEFRFRSYKLIIYTLEALPYYLELLKLYYSSESEDHYYLGFGNSIFYALEKLALKDENCFLTTIDQLKQFMEDNKGLKNINFINYYIDKIKKQYLIANTPQLTCDQVKNKIDEIFA